MTTEVKSPDAPTLARGVLRLLEDMGFSGIAEFTLPNGRRADIFAADAKGHLLIVEVKTSMADWRSDTKWPDYLDYCDFFFFAVPDGFPEDRLPENQGLMVADGFSAIVTRKPDERPLHASRRRALLVDLARTASSRLRRLTDPIGPAAGKAI